MNQDHRENQDSVEDLHDYNSVALSDFNRNPSHFLIGTGPIPLAIRKHGKVQGIYMQVAAYNDLLMKIRKLRADQTKLVQLLDAANPGLLQRHRDLKDLSVAVALLPKWPIIRSMPKRVPLSQYPDLWLKVEAEQTAMEMAASAGNYRLPNADSEDDWGRYAVRHSHEFADGMDDTYIDETPEEEPTDW